MNSVYVPPSGPVGGSAAPLLAHPPPLPSTAGLPMGSYFAIPPVAFTSAPGGMAVGKFPNPRNVFHVVGNNKEAQAFLARGGQVIIRMRGLPYDCTAQQVVSRRSASKVMFIGYCNEAFSPLD